MKVLYKLLPGLFLIVATCCGVLAQPAAKKPDIIQKLDNTQFEAVVDEINKTDILYRKVNDPKGPLYAVPKKEVRRILWNNGDIEDITIPTEPAQNPGNPIALLKKKEKPLLFWDQSGLFGGLRLGAGASLVATPSVPTLADEITLAYNGGATLGYRIKALSVQLEALYTVLSYQLVVPESAKEVTAAIGQQQNLVVPVIFTLGTRIGNMRVGLSAGGFGAYQLGNGSVQISQSETSKRNVRNCASCADKITYGAVGGLTATVLEKPHYAIYVDARWYHSLLNNEAYKIAESGVKMHTGIVGAGVLFTLSGQ